MSARPNKFEYKHIHDSTHNTIGLSKVEVEIINTRAFQRLRNVKQLGLANYVFPGADYSRFSHSIGVCHLTGKMYDAYSKVKSSKPNEIEKQKYRLAGLLHDIGHYPLSHSMEEAINLYIERSPPQGIIKKKSDTSYVKDSLISPLKPLTHESVGREILCRDREIQQILSKNGFNDRDITLIYNLFTRNGENAKDIANLISSDLDADRLDYLLRSAHCVGLPYGSTDIEYILRQITLDKDNKICIRSQALRTIDHFLLCRYFDYSQVVFHKTVAGFEQVLKIVIAYLIENNGLIYSPDNVIKYIESGKWYEYDDAYILKLVQEEYNKDSVPDDIKLMMKSILERKPPKEVAKIEYIGDLTSHTVTTFLHEVTVLEQLRKDISKEFEISLNNIFVWNNGGFRITKATKTIEASKTMHLSKKDADKINQSVRIHERLTNGSTPIMERNDSLMFFLSDKCLYSARLYVMLDSTQLNSNESVSEKISEYVRSKQQHINWT